MSQHVPRALQKRRHTVMVPSVLLLSAASNGHWEKGSQSSPSALDRRRMQEI